MDKQILQLFYNEKFKSYEIDTKKKYIALANTHLFEYLFNTKGLYIDIYEMREYEVLPGFSIFVVPSLLTYSLLVEYNGELNLHSEKDMSSLLADCTVKCDFKNTFEK